MAKTGRTLAVINWDTVGQLLEADCKTVDIARQFGISDDTLTRRCKSDLGLTFTAFSQQKRSRGDNLLRAAQFKAAMEGNTTMLIWLGKQRLDQRDKAELTGQGGGPVVHKVDLQTLSDGQLRRIAAGESVASVVSGSSEGDT